MGVVVGWIGCVVVLVLRMVELVELEEPTVVGAVVGWIGCVVVLALRMAELVVGMAEEPTVY